MLETKVCTEVKGRCEKKEERLSGTYSLRVVLSWTVELQYWLFQKWWWCFSCQFSHCHFIVVCSSFELIPSKHRRIPFWRCQCAVLVCVASRGCASRR